MDRDWINLIQSKEIEPSGLAQSKEIEPSGLAHSIGGLQSNPINPAVHALEVHRHFVGLFFGSVLVAVLGLIVQPIKGYHKEDHVPSC